MSTKHTPGPWTYDEHGIYGPYANHPCLEKVDSWPLARVECRDVEVNEANARLIAAAPDLLGEVVNLRTWLRYWATRTISQQSKDERGHVTNSWAACPIPDWDVKQKLEALDAAITRAEGRNV